MIFKICHSTDTGRETIFNIVEIVGDQVAAIRISPNSYQFPSAMDRSQSSDQIADGGVIRLIGQVVAKGKRPITYHPFY
jgi:hypothetical protein